LIERNSQDEKIERFRQHEFGLITGASSGIGLHLAREFASHGHPLVLVAPVEEELQKISAEITDTYATKVRMLGTRAFQGQNLMAPQDVAKAGYEALMKGELFVVPGVANKALVAARRLLSETAQAKLNEKFYEEVPPEKQTRERGDLERQAD
jgi:short-subunit dehydrogenase